MWAALLVMRMNVGCREPERSNLRGRDISFVWWVRDQPMTTYVHWGSEIRTV